MTAGASPDVPSLVVVVGDGPDGLVEVRVAGNAGRATDSPASVCVALSVTLWRGGELLGPLGFVTFPIGV
jgi:hypothetical protein